MDRPGGYVRIIKTGFRLGDGAETALIELVDFNEHTIAAKLAAPAKKKTRRSRGGSKTVVAAPAVGTDPEVDAMIEKTEE